MVVFAKDFWKTSCYSWKNKKAKNTKELSKFPVLCKLPISVQKVARGY